LVSTGFTSVCPIPKPALSALQIIIITVRKDICFSHLHALVWRLPADRVKREEMFSESPVMEIVMGQVFSMNRKLLALVRVVNE